MTFSAIRTIRTIYYSKDPAVPISENKLDDVWAEWGFSFFSVSLLVITNNGSCITHTAKHWLITCGTYSFNPNHLWRSVSSPFTSMSCGRSIPSSSEPLFSTVSESCLSSLWFGSWLGSAVTSVLGEPSLGSVDRDVNKFFIEVNYIPCARFTSIMRNSQSNFLSDVPDLIRKFCVIL